MISRLQWMRLILLVCASHVSLYANVSHLQTSYQYLVNTRTQGGALYVASVGDLSGLELPLSYYDTTDYWGKYVCQLRGNDCTVTDAYNSQNYTLVPQPGSPGGSLQLERIDVHNGTDIYDAATWQIAVELGQVDNHFSNPENVDAYLLVSNENKLLQLGYDGNAPNPSINANRAATQTDPSLYTYNGHAISANQAYYYRMVTRNWLSDDPFISTQYAQQYISAMDLPKDNPQYQSGKVTWEDWKPITGENAWAFFIGPLQAAYLHYQGKPVPLDSTEITNALGVLPTFAAMQSPIGAIYYVPSGTLGNQGDKPVPVHTVSIENNLSLYAGLTILRQTLQLDLRHSTDLKLSAQQIQSIQTHLKIIDTMIDGGSGTKGLLSFFKNQAWSKRDGIFYQGGLANVSSQSDWQPTLEPKAVDVNTWGVAALGPARVDSWFGFGSAYQVWQNVKKWAGYGQDQVLWGVGYSDRDGNGIVSGAYQQGILSAEWTAGAINMVRGLIADYKNIPSSSSHYVMAQGYVKSLNDDMASMLDHVQDLRIDQYTSSAHAVFPGTPGGYSQLLASEIYQPYLYASKRYMIPFGWFANPLPSTCSTSWMVMIADNFNPFVYSGAATPKGDGG